MPENDEIKQPEGNVEIKTVIGDIESILGNNWGLLSPERREELQKMRGDKIEAAKSFILEAGGKLDENFGKESKKPEGTASGSEEEEEEEEEEQLTPEQIEADKKAKEIAGAGGEQKKNAFGIEFGKKTKAPEALVIDKMEDILPAIKKTYGIELKDIKELPKFFESVNKFRADSQRLPQVEKEAKDFKGLFENLDPTLLDAVKAYYAGNDYTAILNNKPAFDFALDVEKQDVKKLVSHYYKDKITPDQIEKIGTDEQDPATGIAIESSKDKYKTEKQNKDNQIASYDNQAKERVKLFNNSVEGSIGYLEKSFPGVDPAAKARVKQTMSGGIQKIAELFCNPDGTFKEGAAEQLLLAQDGKSVILEMMEAAARLAETVANEEIVNRGGKKRDKNSGGGSGSDISPEVKQRLAQLEKLKSKVSY